MNNKKNITIHSNTLTNYGDIGRLIEKDLVLNTFEENLKTKNEWGDFNSEGFRFYCISKRREDFSNDSLVKVLIDKTDWYNDHTPFYFEISLDELLSSLQNQNADVKILTTLQKALKNSIDMERWDYNNGDGKAVENGVEYFWTPTYKSDEDFHNRMEQLEDSLKVIESYYSAITKRINKAIYNYHFKGSKPFEITKELIDSEENPTIKEKMITHLALKNKEPFRRQIAKLVNNSKVA